MRVGLTEKFLVGMMSIIKEISKAFNQQAKEYERVALVQREIGARLFERLDYMKISPSKILDLGCGCGYFSSQLRLKYPKAQIIGLDLSYQMLLQSRNKQGWWRKWSLVLADMNHLPFSNDTFDLVFANQVLHWGNHQLSQILNELFRIININGCLMFSTLGPDTFKELKAAWSGVNPFAHVNEFADMHDIGDDLIAENFFDPVIDMELLSIHYPSFHQLIDSLKRQGVKNINPKRNRGLTTRNSWNQFATNYQKLCTMEGKFPLSYEVIYGQAWKGQQRQITEGMEIVIPISHIRKG